MKLLQVLIDILLGLMCIHNLLNVCIFGLRPGYEFRFVVTVRGTQIKELLFVIDISLVTWCQEWDRFKEEHYVWQWGNSTANATESASQDKHSKSLKCNGNKANNWRRKFWCGWQNLPRGEQSRSKALAQLIVRTARIVAFEITLQSFVNRKARNVLLEIPALWKLWSLVKIRVILTVSLPTVPCKLSGWTRWLTMQSNTVLF